MSKFSLEFCVSQPEYKPLTQADAWMLKATKSHMYIVDQVYPPGKWGWIPFHPSQNNAFKKQIDSWFQRELWLLHYKKGVRYE